MHVVCYDTETTGLSPDKHEIIEFGAIRLTGDLEHELARLSLKIAPQRLELAEPRALEINGFSKAAWSEAMPPALAASLVAWFCHGCVPMGYNVSFDLKFTDALFAAHHIDRPWVGSPIDTMERGIAIQKKFRLSNHRLVTVAEFMGLKQPDPHRALDDALLTLEIKRRCSRKYGRGYTESNNAKPSGAGTGDRVENGAAPRRGGSYFGGFEDDY